MVALEWPECKTALGDSILCVCACANDLGSAGRICGSRYRLVDSEVVAAVAL